MTINLSVPQTMQELRPRITVIGVGGAGGNAVNNMINADLDGVDFLVANTDGQALAHSLAGRKIQLGTAITQGLGAGSKPDVGRAAAEESIEAVMGELADCNMVFITAGMGGGTGTGAAPVIARAARERGILTVGVVTKPFDFEGQRRMTQAEAGIEEMQSWVDTLIVIPNQNLFRLANERTTFADAFHIADTVLHQGVAGVTDLMIKPGQINLDFADIRAVMGEMGKAMMGTGEASGESRATQAAEAAINNPLLDDITMQGARAVLINVTGGLDMTLFEVDEAANRVRREVDSDAVIIFGSTFDEKLEGVMRVSIVATGIEAATASSHPVPTRTHTGTPSTIISAPKSGAETTTPAIVTADTNTLIRADSGAAATEPAEDTAKATETAGETVGGTGKKGAAETAQVEVKTYEAPEAVIRSPREPIRDSAAMENDTAYVPAFVATKKTSRLAFLAAGKTTPEVPAAAKEETAIFSEKLTSELDRDSDSGKRADERQMSLDEAIERERAAAALGTVTGASNTAPEAESVTAAENATPTPAMVGDSAAEVAPAQRSGFVPPAPTPLPDAESVPETGNGRTSLIHKISGLWTSKPQDNAVELRREPAVETIAPVDSTPSILDLPRADALNRAPEPAAAATLEKSADDLEIPAFLRRQAN
ncbi:MAG: cell division protein FtsZ [Rhodospirillaceae bacterium]|nr:cell division protein FtsZ [Rhodospirillaceae bacterium]